MTVVLLALWLLSGAGAVMCILRLGKNGGGDQAGLYGLILTGAVFALLTAWLGGF